MSAVGSGSVQRVKAYLALGANPNYIADGMFWTDSGVKSWPIVGSYLPVANILARVASVSNPVNQAVILELILAAGADLPHCLRGLSGDSWLLGEVRLLDALKLCELIYNSPQKSRYEAIIKGWLAQTSAQINQWPEPEYSEVNGKRDLHVQLHKRMNHVSKLYECQHVAAPWATEEML